MPTIPPSAQTFDIVAKQILNLSSAWIGLLSALVGAAIGGWFAYLTSMRTADKQHRFQASTYTFDYYREKQKTFRTKQEKLGTAFGSILGQLLSIEALADNSSKEETLELQKLYECLSATLPLLIISIDDIKYVQILFEELNLTGSNQYSEIKQNYELSKQRIEKFHNVSKDKSLNYELVNQSFKEILEIYSFLEICMEVIIIRVQKKLFANLLPKF